MSDSQKPQKDCRGCEGRHPNCHAACKIYAEYKRKRETELAARHAAVELAAFDVARMAAANRRAAKYRKRG